MTVHTVHHKQQTLWLAFGLLKIDVMLSSVKVDEGLVGVVVLKHLEVGLELRDGEDGLKVGEAVGGGD